MRRAGLGGGPSTGDFSTNFPATENPISQGGIWLNGLADGLDWTNIQTANGRSAATSKELSPPPFNDSVACPKPSFRTFTANHFSQGTAFRTPGYTVGHENELFVRMTISAHSITGYEIYWSNNQGLGLVRWNGAINDFTPLTWDQGGVTLGFATTGDILYVQAVGSVITAKLNGTIVGTKTDTTWATGQPGLGNNPFDASSTFFDYGWSLWTAGNLP